MTKEIALSRGQVALVDDEDFEHLSRFRWYPVKGRKGAIYASRSVMPEEGLGVQNRQMQRDILDPRGEVPRTLLADHIDRNTLDNRKKNLRWADFSLSNRNRAPFRTSDKTSRFHGVHFCQTKRVFIVSLRIQGGRTIHRQSHFEETAARTYDALARLHRGSDAVLNFPNEASA